MKRYRLTKITVKTREIIAASKNSTDEIEITLCPICNSPLPAPGLPSNHEKRPTELPPAEVSDDQNKK